MGSLKRLELDVGAREAIRYFTDPLLPTYNHKTKSAAAAGVDVRIFYRSDVEHEIDRLLKERADSTGKVLEYLGTYTMDAARELVNQLSAGRELELMDPTPLLTEGLTQDDYDQIVRASELEDPIKIEAIVAGVVAGKTKKAEVMVAHNKTVLTAVKERRAAAIEIVRQQIGTPEQRIRVTRDDDRTPLNDLSDDKLAELGALVNETLETRKPQVIPEADVEYLD